MYTHPRQLNCRRVHTCSGHSSAADLHLAARGHLRCWLHAWPDVPPAPVPDVQLKITSVGQLVDVLQDDGWWETFVASASGEGRKLKLTVKVGRPGLCMVEWLVQELAGDGLQMCC
jgi:hypothetical protein